MKRFDKDIVACYLYPITRHGYPPRAEETGRHLEEFRELGFRSVELEGIRDEHLRAMHARREQTRSDLIDNGLLVPIYCTVLPGLCDPEDRVREENLGLFKLGCETANALGSRAVLDNAPIPPWKFPDGVPVTRHYDEEVLAAASIPMGLDWDRYWQALVETFREVCDIAAAHGLSYQVHPCHGALVDSTDAFLLFADAVKRDNLKFNLDTANQYFLRENLGLSLLRLKGRVDYIHISDNRGSRVEHLAVGQGRVGWEQFFEHLDRISYKGQFGIDIGGAESDVADLERAYMDAARWLELKL